MKNNEMAYHLHSQKPKEMSEQTKLQDIVNRPSYQGKPKTIEEMNAAVDEEIRRKWQQ